MIQKIVFKNREEWLKHKNESFKLSSSNIGIILGYSDYITPCQYWDKIKKGEITENTNTIRGNLFENSISEYFENVSTERVIKNTQKYFVLRRDDLPEYIEVSPDRELFKKERKKRVILEVKDTKRYIDIYNDDELPKEWYCQIQFQMYVGGYDTAVLCVYDGNKTIQYRYFNLDKDFAEDITNRGIEWTEKYIFGDGIPESDNLEDVQMKCLHPDKGSCSDAEDSFKNVIERYNELIKNKKEIEKEIEECKNMVAVKIGENERLNIGGIECATFKTEKRAFFDTEKFINDNPDEYKKYMSEREYRILRIKKLKI